MTQQEIPEGTVTVLFTDLVESTRLNQALGDDAARQIGRQVEEMARAAVASNRGALIKEMGDGLMAAFASARRAIAAAREMQVQMRHLHRNGLDASVEMRIGLHTGEVIDEDGDLHGETVIIAKRIEGLAPPGGILASETVHGVLGTARDELIDQGAADLKGIDAEWRLYLVPLPDEEDIESALADNEPSPYVGRVTERERLRTMVEAAFAGRGGMVLIGGAPGVGKSRLAREAASMAERLGMAVYTGNCLDMESPPPYQPTIDHLEQAARGASPEGFRTALGVNAPEIAKLLPSLRQRYDDIPAAPDLTPEQERRYMLHGVGEFIERAADNQPMVLTFEDLHWADESTLLLLRHLGGLAGSIPVLVIGTFRDDELEPGRPLTTAIGPLFRDVGAVDLRPRLLSVDEVRTLLTARAGSDAPPELVKLVYSETQGNPFFTEELFRHLRDSGRIFDADGTWRSGFEIGDTEVPQGVRLVIGRRLDQLGPEHRKMLASAAVIGRTFTFNALAAISSADEDDLFDALEAAERSHVIEELPADHPADYLFVQEQIRQTLVGELSLARRQRIHLRIADAMEQLGTGSPAELAHHLQSAGSSAPTERTVDALVAAAAQNMNALAFEDALRQLDTAVSLIGDGDGRFDLRRTQARALRGAGRVDEALAVLDDELRRTSDRQEQVALRLQRVSLLNDQYRAAEGLADVDWLVTAATDDPSLEVDVQLTRGRAYYIMSLDNPGTAEVSRDAYESAYAAAQARGDKANMARALLPTTWFTDYWIEYRPIAVANIVEALSLAEEIDDEDLILDALMASLRTQTGRNPIEAAEELMERLERRRDPVKLNAQCFWMMWQYLNAGRFDDAVATCDRGIQLADLIGSAPVQYGSIKAIALTEAGRYDEVQAAIDQEVTDDDHPFGQAMASLARSALLTRLCAWGPAAESLTETLAWADQLNRVWMQFWAGSSMAAVREHCRVESVGEVPDPELLPSFGEWSVGLTAAQVALAQGDFTRAVDLALPLCPQPSYPTPNADHVRSLDAMAQAHLALGDHDAALVAASHGLGLAETMGFGALIWRLRHVRALALESLGRGDEAAPESALAGTEFRVLAQRIADPDLRAWFERQPLAPSS
ncbi:MAG TPA: AAA family ATPase [Ilumatobacteraceae bacterium]|nr:AAA family ATPase [Ilumatobacteraceae bacterium]